jgi:hypothetical protein
MMILTAIGSSSFMFALFVLFYWHPGSSLDMRIAIAGIYLVITTAATSGVSALMRLDTLQWRVTR